MNKDLLSGFFLAGQMYVQASAPGRLDVMGGIADYSGSMVLQMPVKETTSVAIGLRPDGIFRLKSLQPDAEVLECTIPLSVLRNGQEIDYVYAKEQLKKQAGGDWASYIIGCFLVLGKEKDIPLSGADILIYSEVPVGKGVSSSAALEVATMKALRQLYSLSFKSTELPLLAQKVENQLVGAPCGLMDQLACYFGERGTLLPIRCQPDHVYPAIAIPEGIHFVGIDSGVRHSVGEASYTDVRTAAFMGYSMIANELGSTQEALMQAKQKGNYSNLPYQGYLANIPPSVFEDQFSHKLLYRMAGRYFTQHYPIHIDPVTTVDPEKFYAILDCSRHPVYENFRVNTFILLIQYMSIITDAESRRQCLRQLGELMYQSHTSYSLCGLGNKETDAIVEMVKYQQGNGVYGAKITGGGSGGTVCILCDGKEGLPTARAIHKQYQEKQGKAVKFFE